MAKSNLQLTHDFLSRLVSPKGIARLGSLKDREKLVGYFESLAIKITVLD